MDGEVLQEVSAKGILRGSHQIEMNKSEDHKIAHMNLEENKKNAIAFYKTAYEGNPRKAIEKYVGTIYIQHNPDVADGTQGFIDYFERMQLEYPDKSIPMQLP